MKKKYPTKESETKEAKKWKVYSQKALDTLYKTTDDVGKFFDNVGEFSQETYKKASKGTKKAAKAAGKGAAKAYKGAGWGVVNIGPPTISAACAAGATLFAYNSGSSEPITDVPLIGEIIGDFTPKDFMVCSMSLYIASFSNMWGWLTHKKRRKERIHYEGFVAELRETHNKEIKKLEKNYQNLIDMLREDLERSQRSRYHLKYQLKEFKKGHEESRAETRELRKDIRRLRNVEEEQTISIKELLKKMKYIEKIERREEYKQKAANPGSKE